MNILVDVGHPAHVHLFKNVIEDLKGEGWHVYVVSRDKDITLALLDRLGIEHQCISRQKRGLIAMFFELLLRTWRIYLMHRKVRFDYAIGTSASIGLLSFFSRVKSVNFCEDDDRTVFLYALISYPFSTLVVNPSCIISSYWKKKRKLHNSLHELAYLHPENFKPDVNILEKYGLKPYGYIIWRKSSLEAHHDYGAQGVEDSFLDELKGKYSEYHFLTSHEAKRKHQFEVDEMHHILAFARLLVSDSQSMTIEAAVLGIPSVRISSFVGKTSCIEMLEETYHLTYGYRPEEIDSAKSKIEELLQESNWLEKWKGKKNNLLVHMPRFDRWIVELLKNV